MRIDHLSCDHVYTEGDLHLLVGRSSWRKVRVLKVGAREVKVGTDLGVEWRIARKSRTVIGEERSSLELKVYSEEYEAALRANDDSKEARNELRHAAHAFIKTLTNAAQDLEHIGNRTEGAERLKYLKTRVETVQADTARTVAALLAEESK